MLGFFDAAYGVWYQASVYRMVRTLLMIIFPGLPSIREWQSLPSIFTGWVCNRV